MKNIFCCRHGRLLGSLLLVVLLLGCSTIPLFKDREAAQVSSDTQKKPLGPVQVKADSRGLKLDGRDDQAAREQLVERIEGLVEQERYASARAWVQRYPDVSLDVLRSAPAQPGSPAALAVIAAGYDQQCLDGHSQRGWTHLVGQLQAGTAQHEPYEQYGRARAEVLDHLHQGRAQEAAQVGLPPLARRLGPLAEIDAWQLTAMTCLLDDRPHDAAAALEKASELAGRHDPHQAAGLLLLLSDAQRRLEQHEQATASWQQAVLLGGELLAGSLPVYSPQFWERASYMRPVGQRWPQAVGQQLIAASGLRAERDGPGLADPSLADLALWVCLGRWRLERDEPQAALVALKRAEAMGGDPSVQEPVRLAQAKAMFRLEQIGAATAILAGLGRSENPQVASAAMALLGSMKLQAEQTQLGFNLLHKALENNLEWPGRAQAEADLGLAFLLMGDESRGLRWLHSAQSRFQAQGDHELLAKSLFNESEYFKAQKNKQQAQTLANRLRDVERRGEVRLADVSK